MKAVGKIGQIWHGLSARERSLVVVAAAVSLWVLGHFFLLSPYLERRARIAKQLEMDPQLLSRHLRYLAQKNAIAARLESARAELKAAESQLLSGDTQPVIAANLQDTVRTLAGQVGTEIIATRVLNPEAAGPFTKISIQVEVSGQIDQLAHLIEGIESANKLLLVDEVNLRSVFLPSAQPRAGPAAPGPTVRALRASLTVSGFARAADLPAASKGSVTAGARGK